LPLLLLPLLLVLLLLSLFCAQQLEIKMLSSWR
jgi:hypothetical protein